MYINFFKPFGDRLGALILLILLAPLIAITALIILLKLGRPIVFAQKRPGIHGKIFTLYKFRTMSDDKDENGVLKSDEIRLGTFGQTLRSLSLDELPQVWNVLCGEMSFVGPRPLLVEYLPFYSPQQSKRHNVKPGITGWAQVNGRNALSWEKKFAYDVDYVENISFVMDMTIVLLTLKKVVAKEGISHHNTITMEKFRGNN
jgi:lipopolysaccharide/colanic/teichoic acid biosynthesis glycosyltransferase